MKILTTDNDFEQTTVEDLLFIYANQTVLVHQPKLLRRWNGGGGDRFYYSVSPEAVDFYVSTTTFTKRVMPTSTHLIDWWKKHGENADILTARAADFGTLMHICFADFHLKGYDFDQTPKIVEDTLRLKGHPLELVGEWSMRLNKAVASYATWVMEYEVDPVAIEIMLASDELGIAGTLDLVCYLNRKPGDPSTRVLAQVDFKSGGIHKSAELQLVINKIAFEENFPHLTLDALYSWSPKDYRDEPTYTFKDQSKTIYLDRNILDAYLTIHHTEYGKRGPMNQTTHLFSGVIKPGDKVAERTQCTTIADAVIRSL